MSNPAEELALEQEAARRGISVTQLKMAFVMQGPGGRDVMRDIVEDNIPSLRRLREGQPAERPKQPEPPKPRGSGWVEPRPLGPPPGDALIGAMMDAEDRIWRAERRKQFEAAGLVEPKQPLAVEPLVSAQKPAVPDEPVPPSKPGGIRRI
jgi:hypothetical protein